MKKPIYCLFLFIVLASCGKDVKTKEKEDILIANVNVIDVVTEDVLPNRYVVIASGRIKSITTEDISDEAFKNKIDGTGKFMIPGLAEMHAHIPPPTTSKERIEETLFLYLSNGITTIRGMLGHAMHLELRDKAANGELLSPRIYTSSPSLNGNSVQTKEEAIAKVTKYHKEGYDFLKIHPGIKKEVFDQVVQTANQVGINFAGHVPIDVGIRHALQSKYASIDHIDGFLEGLVSDSENVKPNENGFFGFAFTNLADTTKIAELVSMTRKNEVWIVPTQSLFERWFAPITSDELLQQPEMRYMPKSTLEDWKTRKDESIGEGTGFSVDQWEEFTVIRRQLIKELQDNGHGMLLGSDAPQLFNVPGFSIQHEMQAMLQSGISTKEILVSGTLNPAKFFNATDEFGQIKEGLSADLILLNKNPLEDISEMRGIYGVMVKGIWLDKDTIDKKLNSIAENAAKN